MRKLLLLAVIGLTAAGCDASKEKLNTAMADNQRISAEKDSLLTEVMANATLVNDINNELAKAKNLGANPVAPGEAGATNAAADRQVVLGKIRDAITRLNESEAQLERSKARLAALGRKDSRLLAAMPNTMRTRRPPAAPSKPSLSPLPSPRGPPSQASFAPCSATSSRTAPRMRARRYACPELRQGPLSETAGSPACCNTDGGGEAGAGALAG